jgi:hypothetical protein
MIVSKESITVAAAESHGGTCLRIFSHPNYYTINERTTVVTLRVTVKVKV